MPQINWDALNSVASGVARYSSTPILHPLPLDAIIDACGNLPPIASSPSSSAQPTSRSVDADGIAYRIVEQQRERVNDIVKHAFLQDLGQASVYPGAIIQGKALLSGDMVSSSC